MTNSSLYTRAEQIKDVSATRPHLVILGAGASRAAFPEGDANGMKLPLMVDLINMLELGQELERAKIPYEGKNFEDVYSKIAGKPKHKELQEILENRVAGYFRALRLPNEPTIYDYLVLSLRPKDGIATFNWDPFLWQALERNQRHAPIPKFFFLHGCAVVGYCKKDGTQGAFGTKCSKCGDVFTPTKLLYPILNKNYASDAYIANQWRSLRAGLTQAFLLTIFGYRAPKTDSAAVDLMSEAWGKPEQRQFEEIELIIRPGSKVGKTWDRFIHTHHYTTTSDFFESILAKHPRRSVEAYWQSLMMARFREANPVPRVKSLPELWDWFGELVNVEGSS